MWQMPGAGMNDIVKKVMEDDPMYPADITYPPAMISAGIHIAIGELRGDSAERIADRIPNHLHLSAEDVRGTTGEAGQRRVNIDVHLITPDNAEQYHFPESVY